MIFRLTKPLAAPPILDALKRTMRECQFDGDLDAAAKYLIQNTRDNRLGMWFGVGPGGICACLVCALPCTPLAIKPELSALANWGGDAAVSQELVSAAIAFVKGAGYNRFVALNRSGHPDAAFCRRFRMFGPGKALGTLLEFTET